MRVKAFRTYLGNFGFFFFFFFGVLRGGCDGRLLGVFLRGRFLAAVEDAEAGMVCGDVGGDEAFIRFAAAATLAVVATF